MYKVWLWIIVYLSFLVTKAPIATPHANVPAPEFKLLDKVCVEVEGEAPVLLSEIERRMKTNGISFAGAQEELIRNRLLWFYAKKKLTIDINGIFKMADDYIAKVMEKNRLDKKKFEYVLNQSPYFTTLDQFRRDTATEILQNSLKQQISGQVSISDDQAKEEWQKRHSKFALGYDVIFITIAPKTINKAGVGQPNLTSEFKTANEIRKKITPTKSINDIKKLYGSEKNISVIGPIAYETGSLKKSYEEKLKSDENSVVIGPFKDDGSVTIIWKVKRTSQKMEATALEKVKKELYDRAVMEKLKAVTDFQVNSTVIVKNCGKR